MNWMRCKRSIPNNITLPTVTKHPTISPLPFSSRPFPVFSSRGLTSPGCEAGRPGIAVRWRNDGQPTRTMAWTSRVGAARPPADPLVAQTRDLLSTAAANERPSTDSAIVSGRRCTRHQRIAPFTSPESVTSLSTSRVHCCIAAVYNNALHKRSLALSYNRHYVLIN